MNTFANPSWSEVRFGELLTYVGERLNLDDAAEYATITVKRRHGGLEERERLLGHQIQTKKQFRLIPGAFIISLVPALHSRDSMDELAASLLYSKGLSGHVAPVGLRGNHRQLALHSNLYRR